LAPDQRSFAIGKMGQNINLASRLVGLEIQLQDLTTPQENFDLYVDQAAEAEEKKDSEASAEQDVPAHDQDDEK
jgi:transcription antitermination factor NusA-like protein